MAMIWIKYYLSFLIVCFLLGCASSKIVPNPSSNNTNGAVNPVVNFGPQKPHDQFFSDKTKQYGLDSYRAMMIYAVDLNQDSWTDLVILPDLNEVPIFLTFNTIKGQFEPMTPSPLPDEVRASFLALADFNRDSTVDLVVGHFNQNQEWARPPLRIFAGVVRPEGFQFVEQLPVIEADPLPISSVALLDYDLDGNLDLFAGVWYDYRKYPPAPLPDRLYRGKDFQFTNMHPLLENEHGYSEERGYFRAVPSLGVSSCDVDQNGFPDILVPASSGFANKLWINVADQRGRILKDFGGESDFAQDQEGQLLLQGGGNSFFSVCADYNNDGMIDLLLGELSHSYDPISRDRTSLLTNSRPSFPPKFFRSEYFRGSYSASSGNSSWGQGDKRGSFADLNLDGLPDILIDNTGFPPHSRLMVFLQQANHDFLEVGKDWGVDFVNPSGTILVDLNHDGYLDIISGQLATRNQKIIPRMYVFENQIAKTQNNHSIKILLAGKSANSQGMGAMVIVHQEERIQRQYLSPLSGAYPSQHEGGLTFGLGPQGKVQKIEVRWPTIDRQQQTVLHQTYNFAGRTLSPHAIFTLGEDGTMLEGKQP